MDSADNQAEGSDPPKTQEVSEDNAVNAESSETNPGDTPAQEDSAQNEQHNNGQENEEDKKDGLGEEQPVESGDGGANTDTTEESTTGNEQQEVNTDTTEENATGNEQQEVTTDTQEENATGHDETSAGDEQQDPDQDIKPDSEPAAQSEVPEEEKKGEEPSGEAVSQKEESEVKETDVAENVEAVASKPSEEADPVPTERPVTEHSSVSEQSDTSKKEKDRKAKKKEKRQKKKSKQGGTDLPTSKLKKKSSRSDRFSTTGSSPLEVILLSVFQPYDVDGSGYLQQSVFWEVLQSAELNLQLSADEVSLLQGILEPDRSGQISYTDFSSQAVSIIASLYQNLPASDDFWVELKSIDGSVSVYYNKQTGETRDVSGTQEVDLFAGVIEEMFRLADADGKGFVNKEEFTNMLQSEQMLAYLQKEDVEQMQQFFDSSPNGQATYEVFYPLAKELILRVYRVKDPSESEWCQLNSPQVGLFWFNKFTGETKQVVPDDREQEIAFLNQAYAQVEEVNFELEQYKQENRELQNTLAHAIEEQETIAAQLYETGHALDEANNEVKTKELELDQMRDVVKNKEREIEELRAQVGEMEKVKQNMAQTEQELLNARETIATRDNTMTDRDSSIMNLQREVDVLSDRLKTANGVIDARDSSVASLQRELQSSTTKVQELEKNLSEMETHKTTVEQDLTTTKQLLDEKMNNLATSRKHLKNARERNIEMEKELDKYRQTHDKLRNAECEIQTLKSFLTTKTALVEKRKKELRDTKVKVAELEEKDSRRAVILADVLEKTARQYQQQLATQNAPGPVRDNVSPLGKKQPPFQLTSLLMDEPRPASAPAIPPEGGQQVDHEAVKVTYEPALTQSPRLLKTYEMDSVAGPTLQTQLTHRTGKKTKPKARSRTVPKLPPIRRQGPVQRKTSTFVFPTSNDLSRQHKDQDRTLYDHVSSNPQCQCELCRMNSSIVGPNSLRPETGLTGHATQTAVSGYRSEVDPRELALSQQIRIGQRVIVRMKKSEFDLEPQKLTGIVKYVGKVDSEYVDNRIYAGVKLDDAVGNTDGLIKGKRYFTCPLKHGKVVRISDIVAVLPRAGAYFKPIQGANKRSPYSMPQKRSSSIKVS